MPPLNTVTDPVLIGALQRARINTSDVVFAQDYSHRGNGKGNSPYAKWYSHSDGRTRFMVVSGLPMVDASGDRLTPGWQAAGPHFLARKNLFTARIQGRDVELTVRNDDAVGRKQGATLAYSPRLFVGGVEIPSAAPVLLPIDPWNPNYTQNVLEWDYGICKRKLRTVEGQVHGYWVFPANPGGDVLIRYGQTGDYRLRLGPYRQTEDEEFIPASVFASASYPFEISDSATYNPDASPETTSVDGEVRRAGVNEIWATIIAGAGTAADDTGTATTEIAINATATSNQFSQLIRAILLFDSSALPDGAVISAGVLSVYGTSKSDGLSATPNVNIYGSTPGINTVLVAADYGQTQATAFATAITYAGFSIAGYNDFTLNADGRAAISKTGVSKFSFKNANYDVAASQPAWVSGAASVVTGYSSDQGAGFKPKLVVTYTVPGRGFFPFL